ncbi:hypothetical protein E4U21_001453, partial [Claviceps maximensis]
SSAPLSPTSDLTFGCSPGSVCNPQKPDWCNFWPGPPADDFICNQSDCIQSPPFTEGHWEQGKTHYYPPSYGYFNLDPRAFGLSYDIFGNQSYQEIADAHTTTMTTGNAESQTSLAAKPIPTYGAKPYYPIVRRQDEKMDEMENGKKNKRDDSEPDNCYDECNNAYISALSVGKSDTLCEEGSSFRVGYGRCATCIKTSTNSTAKAMGIYAEPRFAQFIDFCSGKKADNPVPTPDLIQSM